MDVLNDILDTLDLKGAFYFRTDFSSPWCVEVPRYEQAARFHLVIHGNMLVKFRSGKTVNLGPGDLILIPGGRSHILSCSPCEDPPMLETLLADVGYTGDGVLIVGEGESHANTKLVCGHFTFRKWAEHPILKALPECLITTAAMRAKAPILDEILRLMARQVYAGQFGTAASITRLSEIMLIELLRGGIEDNLDVKAILNAFQDKQIGKAVELIHASPGAPWSVESLAKEVGMSRSRFAKKFRDMLGVSPMSYLSDWRLQKALSQLNDSKTNIQNIANDSGYKSPAAFTRAFSDKFGLSPTKYRQQAN